MNECYIIGKILNEPKYDFLFNKKSHISIIKFRVQTLKSLSVINAKAYDGKADYIYRFFSENDLIIIRGWINQKMEFNIEEITKL